ncbi:hypothetical protein CA606_19840 [Caulobacter vibrioides]|uniref:Addiction module antitoxin RelB n=1 Tax=Caulobacter vibrioides TaxID=155892 RepID=A0A290MWZ4_CAUVI|nr:type II toxin-antitoxin system RelE/ParE family toxin [Caulobacter vibrioides]ATC34403.1 hypothetical protein CA606_19840 [Caulobacter vibrioides]
MIEIVETVAFRAWRAGLRDAKGRRAISTRLARLAQGLFGDFRTVGEGVGELRIHVGPGYRLYFVRRGDVLIILLHGGDKGAQARDIEKAKMIARSL